MTSQTKVLLKQPNVRNQFSGGHFDQSTFRVSLMEPRYEDVMIPCVGC